MVKNGPQVPKRILHRLPERKFSRLDLKMVPPRMEVGKFHLPKMGPGAKTDSRPGEKFGSVEALGRPPTRGALRITGLISPGGPMTLAARLPVLPLTQTQRQEGVPRSRE